MLRALVLIMAILQLTACSGKRIHAQLMMEQPKVIYLSLSQQLDLKSIIVIKNVIADLNKRLGRPAVIFVNKRKKSFLIQYDRSLNYHQIGKTQCDDNDDCSISLSFRFNSKYRSPADDFFGIYSKLSEKALANTIRHELAHAFGLGHTEEDNQIMSEQGNPELLTNKNIDRWAFDLKNFLVSTNP